MGFISRLPMKHFMHLVLDGISAYADAPLFFAFSGTPQEPSWDKITYAVYGSRLESAAAHWYNALSGAGLHPGDVVGIWLTGESVNDLVHLFGLARAGFVPQAFSVKYNSVGSVVVSALLQDQNARALVFDPLFTSASEAIDIPTFAVPTKIDAEQAPSALPELPEVDGNDVAMIFHTSGTTSGKPKPVPQTQRWMRAQATVCWRGMWEGEFHGPDVFNNLGNLAHIGSATCGVYITCSGASIIQTPTANIDGKMLLAMVRQCGLNRLFQYSTWLSALIATARQDPEVLRALMNLRQINYTGVSMNPADEIWAIAQRLPMTCMYATTEVAPCLVSDLGSDDKSMRLIHGVNIQMIPSQELDLGDQDQTGKEAHYTKLYSFFVPVEADNCPHPTVRSREDGHETGDYFEEAKPGYYNFRGRVDDWIKCGPPLSWCDTKRFEDYVLENCADLVQNCVVVGHYKPFIVLFIEPIVMPTSEAETVELQAHIMDRVKPYNATLFPHERLHDCSHVAVASPGTLPRTKEKGNIRRKATEESYSEVLKHLYNACVGKPILALKCILTR